MAEHEWFPADVDREGYGDYQCTYHNELGEEYIYIIDGFGNYGDPRAFCWRGCSGDWPGCKRDCPIWNVIANDMLFVVQLLILRCGDRGGAEGIEGQAAGQEAGEFTGDGDRVPDLPCRVQDSRLSGEGPIDKALQLRQETLRSRLSREGAGDLVHVAGLIPGVKLLLIVQQKADAGAGRKGRTLGQAMGRAEGEIRFGLPVPEADEAEGVGIRDHEAAAVERRDVLQRLAQGVLRWKWDLEAGGHEVCGPGVHGDAEDRGDLRDNLNIGVWPDVFDAGIRLFCLQHGVVGVDSQKPHRRVRFACVDVVDAFGDPFGPLGVIHHTEIRPEFGHARDGGGIHVKGEAEISGRCQADAGRPAAESGAGAFHGREDIHAVVGAADRDLDLKGMKAGEDGFVKFGSSIHLSFNQRKR